MWRSVPLRCRLCSPVTPECSSHTHSPLPRVEPLLICSEDTLKRWTCWNESAALQPRENTFTFAGPPMLIRTQKINTAGLISAAQLKRHLFNLTALCVESLSSTSASENSVIFVPNPSFSHLVWSPTAAVTLGRFERSNAARWAKSYGGWWKTGRILFNI